MTFLDLFRAPDAASVTAALAGASPRGRYETLPAVPADLLDALDELIADLPDAQLVAGLAWPTEDPAPWGCLLPPDHPVRTEPLTHELHPAVRDALAATAPDALLALRPYGLPLPGPVREVLPALAGLARRASAAGESLYYWSPRESERLGP